MLTPAHKTKPNQPPLHPGEGWGKGIKDGQNILVATQPAWPPGLTGPHPLTPVVCPSPRLRVSASLRPRVLLPPRLRVLACPRARVRVSPRLRLPALAAAGAAAVVLRPQPAYAMHISDGFLPPVWS